MPERVADVHSMMVRAAGGTVAGTDTNLGTITLPAGGPWTVWSLWGYAVHNAANAAEAMFASMRVESVSGDLTPNPAPSRFPLAGVPSYLGAATGKPLVPLTRWNVNWQAAGKAVIDLHYIQECARTAADVVCMGLIFGKKIPVPGPFVFCDRVTNDFNAAGANAIGTITIAEKAKKITGFGCDVLQDMVSTTAEEILPFFTLTSDDIDLAPAQWPCSYASCLGLATNHGLNNALLPHIIPVDIPLVNGARIDCAVNLLAGTTNDVQASVYIFYE